jgi:hypothetical protein
MGYPFEFKVFNRKIVWIVPGVKRKEKVLQEKKIVMIEPVMAPCESPL